MNSHEFVAVIRRTVRDSAVDGEIQVLEHPPGRRPPAEVIAQSKWYKSLDDEARKMLASIIASAVDMSVFGFLCVLDGVRVVEDGPNKGAFELRYVKDSETLLNDPNPLT
jgi:hypothetical protein